MTRLRDHIERLDDGAGYAADDLAVVLRAWVHPGNGNDVVRRLANHTGIDPRPLMASREVDVTARFSVGSIPTRPHTEAHGARQVSLSHWVNTPVLHVRDKYGATTFTWADFLNKYANKWGGAHLDKAQPIHLQVVDMFGAGGFSLSGYLLRTAGVAVYEAVHEILEAQVPHPNDGIDRTGRRISAPGGIASPPRDRLTHGELQWLTSTGEELGFLLYASGPCRLRVATGGSATAEIELSPAGSTGSPAPQVEARSPGPDWAPRPEELTRRMRVYGQVLAPPVGSAATK